jgi:hypothetical protein
LLLPFASIFVAIAIAIAIALMVAIVTVVIIILALLVRPHLFIIFLLWTIWMMAISEFPSSS